MTFNVVSPSGAFGLGSALIGLAGVFLGGLFTFLGVRYTVHRTERRERTTRDLARLEEIYLAIESSRTANTMSLVGVLAWLLDRTPVDPNDLDRPPYGRMTMLLRFYSPEYDVFRVLIERKIQDHQETMRKAFQTPEEDSQGRRIMMKEMTASSQAVGHAFELLQEKVAERAQEITKRDRRK